MAWRNLWRNRRRTLITLSSIAFGVGLSILMTSMQDRNYADFIDIAARMGMGHVSIQHREFLDSPTLTRTVWDTGKLCALAQDNRLVRRAVPRITGQTMLSTAGESSGAAFIALDPRLEDATTFSLTEAIAEGESFKTGSGHSIVLGAGLAKKLRARLGSRIVYTMSNKDGEIVSGLGRLSGVLHTGSPAADNALSLLPLETVRDLLGYAEDEATQIAIFTDDQRRSERLAEELVVDLQSSTRSDMDILPWFDSQPDLANAIAMDVAGAKFMQIFLGVLVAAGIFNTLLMSVMERMREFGILMAIGFSPGMLFWMVMLESAWLGLLGLVSAALVTIGPYLYLEKVGINLSGMIGADAEFTMGGFGLPTTISVGIFPESLAIIASIALLATLLSGIYPAWKAGSAKPVETIRLV